MSVRSVVGALIALASSVVAQPSLAVSEYEHATFIGVWRLVSFERHLPNGTIEYPAGKDAVGRLTYDAGKRMSAQVMQRGRPVTAFNGPRLSPSATTEDLQRVIAGYMAYYGTYDIDVKSSTVIHHVEANLNPNGVGRVLKRGYAFEGNRLVLTNDVAGARIRIVWDRETDPAPGIYGEVACEVAERLAPDHRVLFHGFDLANNAAMTPEDAKYGWARLVRNKAGIEVVAVVRNLQPGRVYQPRIVGWNNPSACKGSPSYGGRASCSQAVDDTRQTPSAEQFHASFRGLVADTTGCLAFRHQLRVGEGMPPLRDPLAPTERRTNIFWGSHFEGSGLTRPEDGEFFLAIVDKGPAQADLEHQLNGPLFGCRSAGVADPGSNCVLWRRAFAGAIPRKR
jgi:hypothetical protein